MVLTCLGFTELAGGMQLMGQAWTADLVADVRPVTRSHATGGPLTTLRQ